MRGKWQCPGRPPLLQAYDKKKESGAIAGKPRDSAAVRFGLSSPTFTTSLRITVAFTSESRTSELYTHQRKTEFNVKWLLKVKYFGVSGEAMRDTIMLALLYFLIRRYSVRKH